MSLAGYWEFPGGKVEPGESPEAALAREIQEELAVGIEVGEWLGCGEAVVGEKLIHLDVFVARLTGGEMTPKEHSEARWVGADELESLEWAEADVPVLGAVRARLC